VGAGIGKYAADASNAFGVSVDFRVHLSAKKTD